MAVSRALMTSKCGEWQTPKELFDRLNGEFGFALDVAASAENHLCDRYFSLPHDDAFTGWWNGNCFCNPPYGRNLSRWFEKARNAAENGSTVVMLVPARTDTKWFHEHVWNVASEIRFLPGRLVFKMPSGKSGRAPFPSMLVIYRPDGAL
jgi:site-specific DNA-methyltransferase (adenine-specific)